MARTGAIWALLTILGLAQARGADLRLDVRGETVQRRVRYLDRSPLVAPTGAASPSLASGPVPAAPATGPLAAGQVAPATATSRSAQRGAVAPAQWVEPMPLDHGGVIIEDGMLGHGHPGEVWGGGCADGACGLGGCDLGGCGVASCGGCGHCGLCCGPRIWGGGEFINWWRRTSYLPPLVTDGPLPGSTVFFGDQQVYDQSRPGFRATAGLWGNPQCNSGVMARFYLVGDGRFGFDRQSDGTQNLARPFFNLGLDAGNNLIGNDSLDVTNGNPGSITVHGQSNVYGGDALWRFNVQDSACWTVDGLLGYTAAHLGDDLVIDSVAQLAAPLAVNDTFRASNDFHGATGGFIAQIHGQGCSLELLGKCSMGVTHQQAFLSGTGNAGGVGGLLVQPSNAGNYSHDVFSVSQEANLNLVFRAHPCVDLVFGYSVLYFSSVAKSSDLIDPLLRVNPNNPIGAGELPHPVFQFRNSDFWLHGINVGLRASF